MAELGAVAQKVRSKNAGPFWLTVDIFAGDAKRYEKIVKGLDLSQVAERFGVREAALKRFDIPDLNVVKISLPRPTVQGRGDDRDMHGAQWAPLLAEMDIG